MTTLPPLDIAPIFMLMLAGFLMVNSAAIYRRDDSMFGKAQVAPTLVIAIITAMRATVGAGIVLELVSVGAFVILVSLMIARYSVWPLFG